MRKQPFTKLGRVLLGIATEIIMVVVVMAAALGLSWLLSGGWR